MFPQCHLTKTVESQWRRDDCRPDYQRPVVFTLSMTITTVTEAQLFSISFTGNLAKLDVGLALDVEVRRCFRCEGRVTEDIFQ